MIVPIQVHCSFCREPTNITKSFLRIDECFVPIVAFNEFHLEYPTTSDFLDDIHLVCADCLQMFYGFGWIIAKEKGT